MLSFLTLASVTGKFRAVQHRQTQARVLHDPCPLFKNLSNRVSFHIVPLALCYIDRGRQPRRVVHDLTAASRYRSTSTTTIARSALIDQIPQSVLNSQPPTPRWLVARFYDRYRTPSVSRCQRLRSITRWSEPTHSDVTADPSFAR